MTEVTAHEKVSVKTAISENVKKGIALSLLAIPVGIVLWVAVWMLGFVASIVSFVIAWLAVYLYKVGSGAPASRRTAPYILAVIALGVILAFIAGMAGDALKFYVESTHDNPFAMLFTSDYWAYFADNLFNNPDLWSSYTSDIIMTVVFTVIGTFAVVRSLFVSERPVEEPQTL